MLRSTVTGVPSRCRRPPIGSSRPQARIVNPPSTGGTEEGSVPPSHGIPPFARVLSIRELRHSVQPGGWGSGGVNGGRGPMAPRRVGCPVHTQTCSREVRAELAAQLSPGTGSARRMGRFPCRRPASTAESRSIAGTTRRSRKTSIRRCTRNRAGETPRSPRTPGMKKVTGRWPS